MIDYLKTYTLKDWLELAAALLCFMILFWGIVLLVLIIGG